MRRFISLALTASGGVGSYVGRYDWGGRRRWIESQAPTGEQPLPSYHSHWLPQIPVHHLRATARQCPYSVNSRCIYGWGLIFAERRAAYACFSEDAISGGSGESRVDGGKK
jgi:hypothetical protein